jgi:hypothetical protein
MFIIKKKPNTPNMVWDTEKNKPLCKFVVGLFETNDTYIAEKLKTMGYEVTGDTDKPERKGK